MQTRLPTHAVVFKCVLFASFVGCYSGCEQAPDRKFDPVEDFNQFKLQLDYMMEHNRRPLKITEAKVDRLAEVGDDVVRIDFSVTAKYFRDSYIEVNRAKILEKAGWNESSVQAAAKKLRFLPPTDAAPVEKLNPVSMLPPNFYRTEGTPGTVREFSGSCTARRRATKWAFENWNMDLDNLQASRIDSSLDVGVALIPALPPNSMVYNSDFGKKTIADAVQNMAGFIRATDELERKVLERERLQFEKLLEICRPGKSYLFPLQDESKGITTWRVDMVALEKDGGAVRLLIRHPTDENMRRMYEGKLDKAVVEDLGPYQRPVRHPPQLVLYHGGGGPSLFYMGEEKLKLQLDADESPRLFTNLSNAALRPAADSDLLPESETWKTLLARTEPGTQWNGSVTMKIGNSESVIFTVTDRKADGSYMRVVAESVNDPFTMVVFEGSFQQRHVHGWPIVLRATHGAIGETKLYSFFRSDSPQHPPLSLSLHNEGFVGMRGTDKIFLTSTRRLDPWLPRASMIEQLFAQGARFGGRMTTLEDTLEVTLTFAEIRNKGDYVRVVVQEANEPQELAVYEGRIRREPELADGYCVELVKRQHGTKREQLFDPSVGTMLGLRLALDNSAIMGIVRKPEMKILESLKLTRLPSKEETVSMATADFAALIREKLAKGNYWRGTLKDVANNRSVETILRVLEVSGDGLKVELTSSKAGGGRAVYDGLLKLDDASVNGYCVILEKSEGTKIPTSPRALAAYQNSLAMAPKAEVFDNIVGKDRMLKLALSYDGETLLGLAGNYILIRKDRGELLTLRQVVTTKPPSLRMVPVASAPNLTAMAPGEFKLLKDLPGGAPRPGSTTTTTASVAAPSTTTAAVPSSTATTSPAALPAGARNWTSSDGKFSVAAVLVEVTDGLVSLKRTADGTVIQVPLAQLSPADRDFAEKNKPAR